MKRKTIAVDIDDVLAVHAQAIADFSNEQWGHAMTADDYDEDLARVWGVTVPEALTRIEALLASGVHANFKRYDAAVPVLAGLAEHYSVVAVTSRRTTQKALTDTWIERHFPGIFTQVRYAGVFDDSKHHDAERRLARTKLDVLKEIGAEYLIDDQPKHCIAAAEAGITSLLFGDYAWNRSHTAGTRTVRVIDWKAVKEYFDGQS